MRSAEELSRAAEGAAGWGARAIRRPVTTTMVYLCLSGFGLFALYNLPVNRLPEVELPVIVVITNYTGASPEDVETLITAPIERAVASVEGVEKVTSTSRQGTSIVVISFTWGTDMSAAEAEVRKNIEIFAADFLPDEATRPLTFAIDPSLAPVFFLAVEGPMDPHRLRRIVTEQVQPWFGRLPGVAAAEVVGGLDREIQVRIDPTWLQAYGVSPSQIVEALRAANLVVPAGALDDGTTELGIAPTSTFRTVEEIEQVIVGVRGGRPIVLSEVAEVVDTFEEETYVVTADGASALLVAVRKQSDANTVQVSRAVRAALPEIERRLPDGVRLVPLFDEAESIRRAIGNLGQTALLGLALTALVLLAFLRSWRTTLIAAIAIPISVLLTFVAMWALDVTLNLVSLAGLVLAIGMIVDNGIVVLEATFLHVERGTDPGPAAVRAVTEMTMPIVASTLTTMVVFLPILLVEGIAGELFRDMVLTICWSLMCSLAVAITLVPMLASRWLSRQRDGRVTAFLRRATGFLDRLAPIYERGLRASLRRPKTLLGIVGAAVAVSLGLAPLLGRDFLPASDVSDIRLEVVATPGISLEEMRERVAEVEAAIRQTVPEAEVITAEYGQAEGFTAIFGGRVNRANLRIRLMPPRQRTRSQREIEAALTERFADIPGLDVRVQRLALGGGTGGDIEVQIFGEDLDEVRRYAELLRDELGAVRGVRETRLTMSIGSPEIQVEFDRERMRVLGISPGQVASAVAAYYQGIAATTFREEGSEFLVRVRAPRGERRDLDRLRYLPIPLPGGGTVPLSSVATIGDRLGPTDIERENQRRYTSVIIDGEGRDLGALTERIEARIGELGVPEGLHYEISGTAEDLRDAFFKLALAIAAALCLVYMVMASQFESLLEPFVIMATVPLAIIGVVIALAVTGTSIQVTALVGVILLGGVVVNNGIVLIDVLKRRRAEGKDLEEATLEAGRTRLRPILMTAVTTIFGMIPPALGSGDGAELWAPLGRAVVGGMIASTLLTLFVVPTLYVVVARWTDRRRARRGRGEADVQVLDRGSIAAQDEVTREAAE